MVEWLGILIEKQKTSPLLDRSGGMICVGRARHVKMMEWVYRGFEDQLGCKREFRSQIGKSWNFVPNEN